MITQWADMNDHTVAGWAVDADVSGSVDPFDTPQLGGLALLGTADPSGPGSDDARDTLFHFFQDAYHLKDWLKNADPPVLAVEDFVNAKEAMRICTDLCNGAKHFRIDLDLVRFPPRTGDENTAVKTQSVTVHVGAGIEYSWTITSNGKTHDALDLAAQVIADWEQWLRDQGLL